MMKFISDPGGFPKLLKFRFLTKKNGLGDEFSTKKKTITWAYGGRHIAILDRKKIPLFRGGGKKYLRHLHHHTEKKKENTEKKADKREEVQFFRYVVNQLKNFKGMVMGK